MTWPPTPHPLQLLLLCRFLLPVTIGEAPIPPTITSNSATPFYIATAMPFTAAPFAARKYYILRQSFQLLPLWVTKHVTNSMTYRVTGPGYAAWPKPQNQIPEMPTIN